jgi:hypothetical protein
MLAVKEKLCTELLESSASRGGRVLVVVDRLSISAGVPAARTTRGVWFTELTSRLVFAFSADGAAAESTLLSL